MAGARPQNLRYPPVFSRFCPRPPACGVAESENDCHYRLIFGPRSEEASLPHDFFGLPIGDVPRRPAS